MKTRYIYLYTTALLLLSLGGCKKFLEEKPNKRISTPDNLADLQGILNNYFTMNAQYPSLGEIGADDYSLSDASWASAPEKQRNFYLWQKFEDTNADYTMPYKVIFNANLVLETLPTLQLNPTQQAEAQTLKGQALFLRAYYHFALVQLFAPAYHAASAGAAAGIPLKLLSDIDAKSTRASVAENYAQVLADTRAALPLLPGQPQAKYLAAKPAAYALMARVNLHMGNYATAALYADSCLATAAGSSLIDYNTISTSSSMPFSQFNAEVLYDCRTPVPAILAQTRAKIDAGWFATYAADDLRRSIFFKKNADGSYAFKGNYTGLSTAAVFSGIALDEVWLTRAECRVRMGRLAEGVADLNTLLMKRFKTGTFMPYRFTDGETALNTVLLERRKELLFRNLRWGDLKRLNLESATAKTLTRTIKQITYTLKPNDLRYVLPIDKTVILMSGMEQNP